MDSSRKDVAAISAQEDEASDCRRSRPVVCDGSVTQQLGRDVCLLELTPPST